MVRLVDHIVTGAAKDAFIEADALALAKAVGFGWFRVGGLGLPATTDSHQVAFGHCPGAARATVG